MKKVFLMVIIIAAFALSALAGNAEENDKIKAEITKTVKSAYINGVFLKGDVKLMKKGWHEESTMYINSRGKLSLFPIKNWMKSIAKNGAADPNIKFEFPIVDFTENTALVKVEIQQKGKLKYSDYLTLYKFADGWKIIAKSYYDHASGAKTEAGDAEAIKKAVKDSYVNAMFVSGDPEAVKKGWHGDCIINVFNPRNKTLKKNPISGMIKYFATHDGIAPDVKHEFKMVDHVGNAGFVIVEIHYGGRHVYSDYMHVYKFADGWKISTKVYYDHRYPIK